MDAHYRVAIYGSARLSPEDEAYKEVYKIAEGLANAGFDVVTGGGPGLMQAANSGHKSVGSSAHSIGLNIKLPMEQDFNPYLDIKKEFDRFSGRLDTFLSLSDAIIVAPGGVGTLLELFYSWQLAQVNHICETPIILFGEMWVGLVDWLKKEVLRRGLFDMKDMNSIFCLSDARQAVELVTKIHADREKMEHVCVNYERYRGEVAL